MARVAILCLWALFVFAANGEETETSGNFFDEIESVLDDNDHCESGFTKDAGFGVSDTTSNGVRVVRWKCQCSNRRRSSIATCTRNAPEGSLSNVAAYYDFRSWVPSGTTVTSSNANGLINTIENKFEDHLDARDQDITDEEERRKRLKMRKEVTALGEDATEKVKSKVMGRRRRTPTPAPTSNGCEFTDTTEDDSKCYDFAPPNSNCMWASFNQVKDLVEQATGKTFQQYLDDALKAGTGCSNTQLDSVTARSSWGFPTEGGTHFQFGTPKYPEHTGNWLIKPADAAFASYPNLRFDGGKIMYKAALQLLICPDGEVTGKAAGFITTGNDQWEAAHKSYNADDQEETWCGDKIGFSALDTAFRKAVSVGRFQLAKKFATTSETSCGSNNWDGQACLNSMMDSDDAKCHTVELKSICALVDHRAPYWENHNKISQWTTEPDVRCADADWYDKYKVMSSDGPGSPILNIYTDGRDGVRHNEAIHDCFVNRPKDGQCKIKVCNSKFKFGLKSGWVGAVSAQRGQWGPGDAWRYLNDKPLAEQFWLQAWAHSRWGSKKIRIEFGGAYTASAQDYLLPDGGGEDLYEFDWPPRN